jgi:tRNA(fMet)-specific endonuclease VapC
LSYLLDTNACIAVINGRPPTVRQRLHDVLKSGERVVVSSIAAFELWYGVAKSSRVDANAERLALFLGQLDTVSFDGADAHAAGIIRAQLEQSGRPIGAYDTLIAGQAIRHRMILVTANQTEFQRVPALRHENWATPGPT